MRPEQSPDSVETAAVPRVVAPARRPAGRLRALLPWVGVGALAAAVLTGTTIWSAALRPAAAPSVPVLATEATVTSSPSVTSEPPAPVAESSQARAPRRPTPQVPMPDTPESSPPTVPTMAASTPAPTLAATTTVATTAPSSTPRKARNPFGLGNEASCADPGASTSPECIGDPVG